MSLETNLLYQKGINQARQQYSLILLLIKQTKFNALNVISTLFLIFTAPMHQKDTITPLHVLLMKAVFTQHLATFNVSFWDTSPSNRKVLFKGHEMTLYIV